MKHAVSFVLCLALVLIGAGVVYNFVVLRPVNSVAPDTPEAPKRTNVRVQVLVPTTLDDIFVLTGRIEAWEATDISSEATGNIEWQGVEEGQYVKKGQELLRVDTTSLQNLYDQAKARRDLAVQELERARNLREGGISSPQTLDRAIMDRDVAEADLNVAKIRLDKSVIYASMDGIVDKLYREVNEFVDIGKPLVDLVQIHKVKAIVGIPERDIVYFAVGDKVEITLDALPDRRFEGTIYRIATSADLITRTFNTEIELDNQDGIFKPGMTIRARMVRGTFPDAIMIPVFSVLSLENQRFAVVEESGAARVRPIEVGILQGNQVQVTEGLAPGDRLIVVGQRDLREGDLVTVTAEVGG